MQEGTLLQGLLLQGLLLQEGTLLQGLLLQEVSFYRRSLIAGSLIAGGYHIVRGLLFCGCHITGYLIVAVSYNIHSMKQSCSPCKKRK